jgi:seryl-tRNA synthetase
VSEDSQRAFRDELLGAGLLFDSGVDGLYYRSGTFESIALGIEGRVRAAGADLDAQVVHPAPFLPRSVFEGSGYLRSFPDLIGSIHSFTGGDADHARLLQLAEAGEEWESVLTPTEVVMVSAACHPIYPLCSGTLGPEGRRFEVFGQVFRHEPSLDPARMQSFRQHEFVYVGDPDEAVTHRDLWLERGLVVLTGLGLDVEVVVANDPFFGRAGRILAANQRDTELKYEFVTEVASPDRPTAIASTNCHLDHFGEPFGIGTSTGAVAHSSCVGFGLERITLALLRTHGLDPASWPVAVRDALWP